MDDLQPLKAKVTMKLTKMEGDKVIGYEEHEVEMSEEEVQKLWQSQMQH